MILLSTVCCRNVKRRLNIKYLWGKKNYLQHDYTLVSRWLNYRNIVKFNGEGIERYNKEMPMTV